MGMTKAEIKRKFDEIVAFAEIEKFLDTSVKRKKQRPLNFSWKNQKNTQ
jgi:ABC-type polysaccharide/polyol phosphate transport system ATPase subunit